MPKNGSPSASDLATELAHMHGPELQNRANKAIVDNLPVIHKALIEAFSNFNKRLKRIEARLTKIENKLNAWEE